MLHEMPNLIVIIAILNTEKLLMYSDYQSAPFPKLPVQSRISSVVSSANVRYTINKSE